MLSEFHSGSNGSEISYLIGSGSIALTFRFSSVTIHSITIFITGMEQSVLLDNAMIATVISAAAAIIASVFTIYLTKKKEREAEWRAKKLSYYEEFFAAASGIVGKTSPPPTKVRFANAVNNLHLIASQNVIAALHNFCDEIAFSNKDRATDRHDELWSKLVWQIRNDLGDPPTPTTTGFAARLWASGVAQD